MKFSAIIALLCLVNTVFSQDRYVWAREKVIFGKSSIEYRIEEDNIKRFRLANDNDYIEARVLEDKIQTEDIPIFLIKKIQQAQFKQLSKTEEFKTNSGFYGHYVIANAFQKRNVLVALVVLPMNKKIVFIQYPIDGEEPNLNILESMSVEK